MASKHYTIKPFQFSYYQLFQIRLLLYFNLAKVLSGTYSIYAWALIFIPSIILGFYFFPQNILSVNKQYKTVTYQGTPWILIILMTLFSFKFFFGFMHATHHEVIAPYTWAEMGVSTLFSGIFWGKLTKSLIAFFKKK